MEKQQLPLLEFDQTSADKIRPDHFESTPKNLPERCVIAFSATSVETVAQNEQAPLIGRFPSCTVKLPIYEIVRDGMKIALVPGFLGSAGAAGQIEELAAGGVKKIVACGSAGTLTPKPLGAIVVPTSAVRDEGASFHYAPPSYEIEADKEVAEKIAQALQEQGLPHVLGKTWTTDAIYRETEDKVALRRAQGCLTVEMECSAMIAVARFRGVKFGQILYCGDDLSGDGYDHRNFTKALDVRRNLIEYALQCVKKL